MRKLWWSFSIAILLLPALASAQLVIPEPPPLPAQTSAFGDAMDSLILGGAFRSARQANEITAAEDYQLRLRAFVDGLTPEQSNELVSNKVEWEQFSRGVAYLQTMRALSERRAHQAALARSRRAAGSDEAGMVYSPSECIGAIVNGECHGSILPNAAYHPTCHGQMLNGICTGPMF